MPSPALIVDKSKNTPLMLSSFFAFCRLLMISINPILFSVAPAIKLMFCNGLFDALSTIGFSSLMCKILFDFTFTSLFCVLFTEEAIIPIVINNNINPAIIKPTIEASVYLKKFFIIIIFC